MRTIASKLIRIYLVIAISTVSTTDIISLLYLYHHTRFVAHENLKTQAASLAGNLESAVAFGDASFAQQILNSLKHYPEIILAGVLQSDGHFLAKYETNSDTSDYNAYWKPLEQSEFISIGKHGVIQEIAREGNVSTHLMIVASMENLNWEALLIFLASMLIGSLILFTSYAMFWRMSRAITRPIEDLTAMMRTIGCVGDHGQEITIAGDDEIGELAIALDNMRCNIRQRTAELLTNQGKLVLVERQQAVVEATTRAKDLFLANMSHEIRTPMNAIMGLNDLALKQDLHPKVRDYLIKIRSASRSLLRIINDILDFSKIETGQLVLEQIPLHLGDLFDHLSDMLRNQAAEKNIELIMEISQDCPISLSGDALRLEQILINLISNAIKFTEQGMVHVLVKEIKTELLAYDESSHRLMSDCGIPAHRIVLEFSVRDSGIGLSSDQIEKLFRPFVQADDSTTRKYGGTGLGLSICKRLVELMGGQIGVESAMGQGSVFHFTIVCETHPNLYRETPCPPDPLRGLRGQEAAKRSRGDEADYTDQLGGIRLLLVEDMPINQQVAHELLAGVGILVDVANDGVEAVQMVKSGNYDAVLMDIQMPLMDGHEATRTIRRDLRFVQLPIIAMTAHAMTSDREKSLAAGMNDHIVKPIDPDRLFSLLMTHIKPSERVSVDREILPQKQHIHNGKITAWEKIPGIDMESALHRVMGNQTLLMRLLLDFGRDYNNVAEDVRKSLARGESERSRRIVHQIKGLAGNIGAGAVYETAQTLELAIEQGRESDWPALIDIFESELQEVLSVIINIKSVTGEENANATSRRENSDPVEVVDSEAIRPSLIELAAHLNKFSIAANSTFNAIKPLLLQAGFQQEVERMTGQIDRFKFKEARTSLEAIAGKLGIFL